MGGGGIFTVKLLTFSGKSAEKVMGVNGFDCPAFFWEQEGHSCKIGNMRLLGTSENQNLQFHEICYF